MVERDGVAGIVDRVGVLGVQRAVVGVAVVGVVFLVGGLACLLTG